MRNILKIPIYLFCCTVLIVVAVYLIKKDPSINDDFNIFKRAQNRTYKGFEMIDNQRWKGDFIFIQGADPQYGLMEAFDHPNLTIASNWTRERELLKKASEEWNKIKPKFVVICGDLVNDQPGKLNSRRRDQLDDLKMDLRSKFDYKTIPLVLMGGNHDLEDDPTTEALQQYQNEFGDDYYSFWVDGVMFIVLNMQFYKKPTSMKEEYDQQNKWLDEQLKLGTNATHIIVLQHIPWFLNDIDEPEDPYFNIEPHLRKEMIQKLYDGGVRHIFAGHYHRNANGTYNDLEMTTTSAIGAQMKGMENARSGYRLVNVTKSSITHQYIDIEMI